MVLEAEERAGSCVVGVTSADASAEVAPATPRAAERSFSTSKAAEAAADSFLRVPKLGSWGEVVAV